MPTTDRIRRAEGGKNKTRQKILDVAERMFANFGFDGTSLRVIMREAGANNGAVFYYFRTKQALFEEVFERLAVPLINERLARLRQCHEASDLPPLLDQIVSAYLTPALKDGFETPEQRWRFAQIRAQLLQAHHSFMRDLLTKHFTKTGEEFLTALGAALPHLDRRDLQWRYHAMIGAMTFAMGGPGRLQLGVLASEGDTYDPSNMAEALDQMIILGGAMFRAPPSDHWRGNKSV